MGVIQSRRGMATKGREQLENNVHLPHPLQLEGTSWTEDQKDVSAVENLQVAINASLPKEAYKLDSQSQPPSPARRKASHTGVRSLARSYNRIIPTRGSYTTLAPTSRSSYSQLLPSTTSWSQNNSTECSEQYAYTESICVN